MRVRASLLLLTLAGCASRVAPSPAIESGGQPIAETRPHTVTAPAGDREDPYYWLRDDTREDPDVIAYLEAENAWTDQAMASIRPLQDELFAEMKGRIQEERAALPYRDGGWWYQTRYVEGGEYPVFVRWPDGDPAAEQVLLDGNARAEGHSFYGLGGMDVSPSGRMMAWLEDTVGRRQNTLWIRDLVSGEITATGIERVSSIAWADDQTLFFGQNDPTTLLTTAIHRLLVGGGEPTVVYEEQDPTFYMWVDRSRSDAMVTITLRSTEATELRVLPVDQPDSGFQVFLPRQRGHRYSAQHLGDRWIVRSDHEAPDGRLFTVPHTALGTMDAWRELVPPEPGVAITGFVALDDFLAINERRDGLRRLRVLRWDGTVAHEVASDQSAYVMWLGNNPETSTRKLRYRYTSPNTPITDFELDLDTGVRTQLDQEPVLGGFSSQDYVVEYVDAPARDGEQVPVTVVRHVDTPLDGTAPLYQTAYGSYGASSDPYFSSNRLSLLDRGFVVATAHVRGGQELGRRWYEDGRLLNKQNTFDDFVDVTAFLADQRYADPERVYAVGGSAGGLLVGAVANQAPERYHGMVAHVPFVDVVTTMLDPSIPLTTNEYDEWGNPEDPTYYAYMLAYSPYDQVRAQAYPNLLVTSGLWDSQVQYFEPTKWVAKLRATKTDANQLLLYTNMEAGHGGASGRFARLRETAMEYAWVIDLAGAGERAAE